MARPDLEQEERVTAEKPVPLRRRARLMAGLLVLLVLIGINLAIGSGKLQVEKVISASMEPTLMVGDRILVDGNAVPNRYDIVCLSSPEASGEKLVKRLMAIPGDLFMIQDGTITINGQKEISNKIIENSIDWKDMKVKVPKDTVYVLGDNRNNSHDSLNFGPVPYHHIRGVVNFIIWPPRRWGRPQKLH